MVSLFVVMALQASATPVRIECVSNARQAGIGGDGWPLNIILDVQGAEIASAVVEGPRLFSSYRPGSRELRPRNAQWRGRFQGRAIRLRRDGADVVLEPRDGAQEFSGFWTVVQMVEHRRLEANGGLRCRTVAGTLIQGARP